MSLNRNALWLAMVAAIALSAAAAPQAQAFRTHDFSVWDTPTIITGQDESGAKPVFSYTGGAHSVECGIGKYEGTQKSIFDQSITLTPTFTGCEVDGLVKATVDVNHCAYVLWNETDVAGANGDAVVEIECATGSEIWITYETFGWPCEIDITPKAYRGVHYTGTVSPTTGKKEITAKLTVSGIIYHEDEVEGSPCPDPVTKSDGKLSGAFTLQAYVEQNGCKGLELTGKTTPSEFYNNCEGEVQTFELNENATMP